MQLRGNGTRVFRRLLMGSLVVAFSATSDALAQSSSRYDATVQASQPFQMKWYRSTSAATKAAKSSGKQILVFVRSPRCHYCDLMDAHVWSDPQVANALSKDFIPLMLQSDQNRAEIEPLKIKGYPATFLFSSDQKYISRIDGYKKPLDYYKTLKQASTEFSRNGSRAVVK